jgi:hypothetical protein
MGQAMEKLEVVLATTNIKTPRILLISNVDVHHIQIMLPLRKS